MTLTGYGRREWGIATVVAIAAAVGIGFIGWWWLLIPVFILWFAVAAFFRDPVRDIPVGIDEGVMLSPSDGVISAITNVDEHDATDGPAIIIRTFLSVLNVHVNRAPCACEVVSLKHTPGKYLNAQTPESAKVNESNLMVLRTASGGERIGLKQIAGMIARRIVCPVSPGDPLARGEKYGMIKFGSTTELILPRPDDVTVHVSVGQKVVGGITMLATMAPASPEIVTQDVMGEAKTT